MIPRIEKGTLEFVRLSRLYAALAGANPAFQGYPTLGGLLAALFGREQADPGVRRRLLCAVIAEHRAAPSPLGPAVVIHAFRGMLVHLSKSLAGVEDRDEADAYVAAALLEALGRVRPERDPDRIGMYVRQETRRAVFAALARDGRGGQYRDEDDPEAHGSDGRADGESHGDEEPLGRGDRANDDAFAEAVRDPLERRRAARRVEPDETVDPMTATPLEDRLFCHQPAVDAVPDDVLLPAHAVRGGLRRLVEHLFEPATDRDRVRLYRELVRRAERAAARATRSGK